MKKFLLPILSLFIIPFFCFNFVGCGEKDSTSTIMTLSLNPKIEFIIDSSDKVASAHALNNDGNLILLSEDFLGDTYQNASQKFIELCYKFGYILKDDNQPINLAISGNNSTKMFDSVKISISNFLAENEYNLEIKKEDLPNDYLKNSVKKAYLNLENVDSLNNSELMNLLLNSRIETQNLYTQELKEFYYQDRAKEVLKAEIIALKTYIQENGNSSLTTIMENVNNSLDNTLANLDNSSTSFINNYMQNEGEYRTKINSYMTNKKGLLEARLSGAENDVITAYSDALTITSSELEDMYTTMTNHLSTPLNSLIAIRNTVFDGIKVVYKDIANTINEASKKASENYNKTFSSYNLLEKNDYWKNMTPSINN